MDSQGDKEARLKEANDFIAALLVTYETNPKLAFEILARRVLTELQK